MTHKIFNVVRSTPTLWDHAQRIKILVNLKRFNTSTIDLNNKRLPLSIIVTTCIPITDILSEIPSTLIDQLLLESLQDDWSIFLLKITFRFLSRRSSHTKPLRDLILDSKRQPILREHSHLESKQTTKALQFCSQITQGVFLVYKITQKSTQPHKGKSFM